MSDRVSLNLPSLLGHKLGPPNIRIWPNDDFYSAKNLFDEVKWHGVSFGVLVGTYDSFLSQIIHDFPSSFEMLSSATIRHPSRAQDSQMAQVGHKVVQQNADNPAKSPDR